MVGNLKSNTRRGAYSLERQLQIIKYEGPESPAKLNEWLDEQSKSARNMYALHYLQLGSLFIAVKEQTREGRWLKWVHDTFSGELSARSVEEYMRVARMLTDRENGAELSQNLPLRAARILARSTTPPKAVNEVMEKAETAYVSTPEVEKVIEKYSGHSITDNNNINNNNITRTRTHEAAELPNESWPGWVSDIWFPLGGMNRNQSYKKHIARIEAHCEKYEVDVESFAQYVAAQWTTLKSEFRWKDPLLALGNKSGTPLNIQFKKFRDLYKVGPPKGWGVCPTCNSEGYVPQIDSRIAVEPDPVKDDWGENSDDFYDQ